MEIKLQMSEGQEVHPTLPKLEENIVHFTCNAANPCGYHRRFNIETGEMELLDEGEYGVRHEGTFINQVFVGFSSSEN